MGISVFLDVVQAWEFFSTGDPHHYFPIFVWSVGPAD
jgi:hypothetical protein